MCGIIGAYGFSVGNMLSTISHRGPDHSSSIEIGEISLGHTRLSILDIAERSNQPFLYGDTTLVYNGELWNYAQLRSDLENSGGYKFNTTGDTEVVAAMLDTYGAGALPKMEGMFALAWARVSDGMLCVARDRFGEIPVYYGYTAKGRFAFCSEMKGLRALGVRGSALVPPGSYISVPPPGSHAQTYKYYHVNAVRSQDTLDTSPEKLYSLIDLGARERSISDVPVCTLLSGGIDSAAIAARLKQYIPNLVAYTAVLDSKSRDLRMARLTAEALEIDLVEVKVDPPSSPDDMNCVVKAIEMPHKAQVEIGWACLKLAEAMHVDGFKVTFSGEGSDELWGSYGFSYHGIKKEGWYSYRKNLFYDQHRKNFARCNKVFMANSVECRLPFLHTPLVEYALSLSSQAVREGRQKPKAIMERAFKDELPKEVLNRPKVAFQDGMGLKKEIAQVVADPRRFYGHEYKKLYG